MTTSGLIQIRPPTPGIAQFVKTMKKPFALLSALLVLTATSHAAETAAEAAKPNILFILVDDFGWRDLACYGSSLYETPNLDRLAASGARFTDAYVSYPRCVPSRFAMMTGKSPARYQGSSDGLQIQPGRDTTVGQAFQAAGYATFYCGKWHLGEGGSAPSKNGFLETFAAGAAGATRSHFAPYNTPRRSSGGGEEKSPVLDVDNAPEGEYLADRLTAETERFIRVHANQPFFAVLAHYAVHTPIEGKTKFTAHYQEKLKGRPAPEKLWEKESAGENRLTQDNAAYAAMVQSADESVGKLLGLLDELKINDKTIVVLMGDNGGLSARGNNRAVATSNRPLRAGKGHLYEGGLRVPLLVRWPGIVQGGRILNTPVIGADLFPTFLDMAGLPQRTKEHLDGTSWAALLRNPSNPPASRELFWHNPAPRPVSTADWFSSAIRAGNLKLLEFPETNRIELYDLSSDLGETTNLADKRPEDTKHLLDKLHQWQKEVGAAGPKARRGAQAARE
jgi:arylsulfatase A-like enzyme